MIKTNIATRVYRIAEQQNIYQTTVHTIIASYIDYCKESLLSGHIIDFFGLVTVVPDVVVDNYRPTLSYVCSEVADKLHLPSHTVYVIVREYLNAIIEDIMVKGRSAEIRGIASFKTFKTDGVPDCVHASLSVSLKNLIDSSDSVIHSARVHSYKILRDRLKTNSIS